MSTPFIEGSVADATDLNNANFVAIRGDYAFVTSSSDVKLAAIDVSDPSSPTTAGLLNSVSLENPRGVAVVGNYAYVASASVSGKFFVVDVSNLASMSIVGTESDALLNGSGNLVVSGNYAYVTSQSQDRLIVVDISTPTAPNVVGSITHADLDGPVGLTIASGYAYVACATFDGLVIIDISTPSSPSFVGSVSDALMNGAQGVVVTGGHAFVTGQVSDRLVAVSVSTPASPSVVGSVTSADLDGAQGVVLVGGVAYVAATNADKVTAVDISTPSAPSVIGSAFDATDLDTVRWLAHDGTYIYAASAPSDTLAVLGINAAPNAPTLTAPIDFAVLDVAAVSARFEWTFSDDDAGDSQSEYDLRYREVGASAWAEVNEVTVNEYRDFIPSALGEGDWEWQARTYDALGDVGPYAASGYFSIAGQPPTPTITAPANESTISSDTATVTWSAPNQDAYQVRTVADSGGSPDTGTVYTDTGTVTSSGTRSRVVAFDTTGRTEHVQVRIRYQGLWSEWASNEVDVSYTPPATPTIALTPSNATGSITVTVTQPSPTGSQPTVETWDVYVRVAAGGRADLERPVGGDGIRIAADIAAATTTFVDRAIASEVDYEYRVRSVGDNGTSVYSAWEG